MRAWVQVAGWEKRGRTAALAVNEDKCMRQTLKSHPWLILSITKLMKETVAMFFVSHYIDCFPSTRMAKDCHSLCMDLEDSEGILPCLTGYRLQVLTESQPRPPDASSEKAKAIVRHEKDTAVHNMRFIWGTRANISVWNKVSLRDHYWYAIGHENQNQFSSVTQSCQTLCDPHEPQHARPPCPTPGVYPNSCRWCHLTISSSVITFSSCLHSFPTSES